MMIVSLFAMLMVQQAPAEVAPVQGPQVVCSGDGYDAFDFWVGQWDVYRMGSETKVSESTIERLYGQCAIRESWMPQRGFPGGSLSSYDADTGRWQQTWVGGRGRVEFEGGAIDKGMVLTGYWPDFGGPSRTGLVRMTYSRNADGSVRQHGEVSFDHGLTWADAFDFTYRPKGQ